MYYDVPNNVQLELLLFECFLFWGLFLQPLFQSTRYARSPGLPGADSRMIPKETVNNTVFPLDKRNTS